MNFTKATIEYGSEILGYKLKRTGTILTSEISVYFFIFRNYCLQKLVEVREWHWFMKFIFPVRGCTGNFRIKGPLYVKKLFSVPPTITRNQSGHPTLYFNSLLSKKLIRFPSKTTLLLPFLPKALFRNFQKIENSRWGWEINT